MSIPLIKKAARLSLPFTPSELCAALRQKPYIHVPFSIQEDQIQKAVAAFFDFLDLPGPLKTHIDLKISPLHRRGEIGFRHRDPGEDIYDDSKDFFHFHPLILEKYQDFLTLNPQIGQFMNQAMVIWQAATTTIAHLIGLFETQFPGTYQKIFDTQTPHIILRFLRYNWATSGHYLAKPHFDAGSFTLAISESCPGLRIGTNPDDLMLVDQREGQAVFMVSSNFQKIIPTNEFSPGWHDVIQLDETIIGKPFARWAVVVFVEGHSVESLSRQDTHRWK